MRSLSVTRAFAPKYLWYIYTDSRDVDFTALVGKEKQEFTMSKKSVFGIREFRGKWELVDPDIDKLVISKATADRLINNSKGYHGKIKGVAVKPGQGGQEVLDKARDAAKSTGKLLLKINSSMINRALYDKRKKLLYIVYNNGNVWEYKNVSTKEVLEFEQAPSQGKWFNEHIRDVKQSQRLDSLD